VVRFAARSLVQSLISLAVLVTIVFVVSRLVGDPDNTLLPPDASAEDRAAYREVLGLDRPLPEQYLEFMRRGVTGDLGTSYFFSRPVSELLGGVVLPSLELVVASMVVALLLAIVPGVYAAVRRGKATDVASRAVVVFGGSMPEFWIGLLLIQIFAVQLGWFDVISQPGLAGLVLPAVTLGWAVAGNVMRLMRSSMIDVLGREYIDTARMKGLPERTVVWKHAFKNAVLPVATYSASISARLLGAAVVIEFVFGRPGLGSLLVQAVNVRDFPTVQGVVFVLGAFLIVSTLLLDLLYAYLNPRVRLS
jgi:peptide/nickel transport system permease protein